jgi:hypothetical protein
MAEDEEIASDLQALARATTRGLPSLDETARALAETRAKRKGALLMALKKPLVTSALTIATAAAILVFPVPYTHVRGYDVTFMRSDGRAAHLYMPIANRAKVQARAQALAHGATVTINPRGERVWGSVFAMAQEKLKLLHADVDVDMRGKNDTQIADELKEQLASQGWDADRVDVERNDDETRASISVGSGDAKRFIKITQKGNEDRLGVQLLKLSYDPNLTDAQIKQQILDELKARGLEGEVTVNNGKVQLTFHKRGD